MELPCGIHPFQTYNRRGSAFLNFSISVSKNRATSIYFFLLQKRTDKRRDKAFYIFFGGDGGRDRLQQASKEI